VTLYSIPHTYILLTLGVYILSEKKENVQIKKLVISPVMIAIVLGILGAAIGGEKLSVFVEYAGYLANLCTPLSMLILGFHLSTISWKEMFTTANVYTVSLMKLIATPVVVIIMLLGLNLIWNGKIDIVYVMGMLIAAAVPTAASTPAMAQQYGKDARCAAMITIGCTILSILSIPLLCAAAAWLF